MFAVSAKHKADAHSQFLSLSSDFGEVLKAAVADLLPESSINHKISAIAWAINETA